MTDKIEPALSAEEWADSTIVGYFDWQTGIVDVGGWSTEPKKLPAQLIALANAALPDSDPRKITREHVDMLRGLASVGLLAGHKTFAKFDALANALESYLPPE